MPKKIDLIPIVIKICAFVISTEGPRSGPKWRNLPFDDIGHTIARFLGSAALRSK